jgi:thiol-disulfide isomerase/thioredoxin
MTDYLTTGLQASGITLLLLVLFVTFYWAFRGFLPASRMVELDLESDLAANRATFYFFYVKWCPYSQDAIPKVESLAEIVKDFTYGGKTVEIKMIDCDVDSRECETFKVDAYPAFKLQTKSKLYEYLGPGTVSVMRSFLKSALGPEQKVHMSSDSE